MIPWLDGTAPFPDVRSALNENEGVPGLLAAGGDLTPDRLLAAYRQGIFPWYSEGQPILWWSPDPRMVLFTERFVVSTSLNKTLKKIEKSRLTDRIFEVRFDSAFHTVMLECAAPRRSGHGTWISEEIVDAYTSLHAMGHAHSAELWCKGNLVGGAYGVCIGRMFYGESMFARMTDASKVALAYLVHFLKNRGVEMIDCQQETSHLASLGAIPIPREEFVKKMQALAGQEEIRDWRPLQLFDRRESGESFAST